MTDATNTPPPAALATPEAAEAPAPEAPAPEAPAPEAKVISVSAGPALTAWSWVFLTPTCAMVVSTYPSGSHLMAILVFVVSVGILVLILHPKSPLCMTNLVVGLIVRIAIAAGLTALLVAKGLPVWAVIYGGLAAFGIGWLVWLRRSVVAAHEPQAH